MNILVIGGGGREHAIIRHLRQNPAVETIWALPGNAGMDADATRVRSADGGPMEATDVAQIVGFAKSHAVDYAIVTPDDPLCLGVVDELAAIGVPAFGPTRAAARIEGSKAFAKDLMHRHGIPTADYKVYDNANAALAAVETCALPVVVKADGLALGKGVTVATTREEAVTAVREAMVDGRFGVAGARVVIEEFMAGTEASLMLLTDGTDYKLMPAAMDHKRALDGDAGPNTGGMGAIAPHPLMTPEMTARVEREIVVPVLAALREEGCPFTGCLYAGLMLTSDGPKVVEFNCRFGDPETQAVLALLDSDLLVALRSVTEGTLASTPLEFRDGAACCVVLASGGYPGVYHKGYPISGCEYAATGAEPESTDAARSERHSGGAMGVTDARRQTGGLLSVDGAASVPPGGCAVAHDRWIQAELDFAGVNETDGVLTTNGGRVVGVTATGPDLAQAIEQAYQAAGQIHFEGVHMRRDIGRAALAVGTVPTAALGAAPTAAPPVGTVPTVALTADQDNQPTPSAQ